MGNKQPNLPPLNADVNPDIETEANIEESIQNEPDLLRARIRLQELEAKGLVTHNKMLENYSVKTIWQYVLQLIFIILISLGVFKYVTEVLHLVTHRKDFDISDPVMIALLGTTSINIIGLLAIVLKFIFSNDHHKILDRYNK